MDEQKDGELGILARRRIEAAIIAPIYDEMRNTIGADKSWDILHRAIRRAAIDGGAEMASRAEGGRRFLRGLRSTRQTTRTQTIMGGASHCDFRYRSTPPLHS